MTKSDIQNKWAKRLMVVFVIIFFSGVVANSVNESLIAGLLSGLGVIGFIVTALIARGKKESPVFPGQTSQSVGSAPTSTGPEQTKFGRTRFSPGPYLLDLSRATNIPLQMNGRASTFGEVYRKLRESKTLEMEDFERDRYVTDEGEINLDGEIEEWPLRATIRELADLIHQGANPHRVTWYYFDHDWSIDADETHHFFAVHENKVLQQTCSFSSEEPLIFKKAEKAEDHIWNSHQYFDEALEFYWYRKFYTETMTGQLMVLRADEPVLFHFERPSIPEAISRGVQEPEKATSKSKVMQWLLLFVVSTLIGLYTAFVFMIMWNWFVAQTLSFHELSFWEALGLFWLIGLLKGMPEEQTFAAKNRWDTLFLILDYCVPGERLKAAREQVKEKAEMIWTDAFGETLGHAFGVTVTLGLGWVVHSLAT